MEPALVGIRVLLGLLLLAAAVGKLTDATGGRRAMAGFGVPEGFRATAARGLPLAEVVIAIGLVITPAVRFAAAAAVVLMLVFTVAIAAALRRGEAPDCHCFGQFHSERANRAMVLRNLFLAALAAVVLVAGPGPGVPGAVGRWSVGDLGVALGSALLIVAVLASIQLASSRRRRRRSRRLPPRADLRGTSAPQVPLDVVGGALAPSDVLRPARPTVLVFASPGCHACESLLADVGRWQATFTDEVVVAVIVAADPPTAGELTHRHGLRIAFADTTGASLQPYGVRMTPAAVLVEPGGLLGSSADGAPAIEALVRSTLRRSRSRAPATSSA